MQCEGCSHLIASANHLIFFVRSSFDVRLALKPEMNHVPETVTTQSRAIHCENCSAPLGMKSPDQPTLWCIGTGNVILFGRKLTNYQKWRDFFTRYPYSLIEVRPTQIGADNNINENFNVLNSNVDSTRLSFADPSNIEHFLWKNLLASKKRLLDYQLLGFIQALLTNTIIVLPTGSGKTLIAALIVARMKEFYPKLMILFIVERVHLVIQQGRYLEQATHLKFCCLSAENITEKKKNLLIEGHYDVLVVTAGCMLNMHISLNLFSCIIFDECHHATGNHPYSQVLRVLQNPTQRIVGLTASPVPVKSSIDQTVTSLEKLSARLFNASYFTYSGPTCGHRAELILIVIRHDIVIQRSIDVIKLEMNKLVHQLRELYPSSDIEIDNWENVAAMAKLRGILFNSTWDQGEAKKLVDQLLKKCNELEKINLLGIDVGETYHRPSPRMYELLSILRASENQDSKIIVFVSTRKAAEIVTKYLEQIPEIKKQFNPLKIVGQAGAFDISWEEGQKKAMRKFYGKTCNLLVSTAVLEEGTNIPKCDIVIRFDKLTISLISYVQARGRARKENSKYILIMNADDAKTHEKLERDENQIEKALDKLNSTDSSRQLSREIHTILERIRSHFNPNHPSDKSIDYTPDTGSDCSIELYIETGEDTHKKDILKNSIDSAFSDLNIATDSMEVIPQEYVPTLEIFLNTDKLVFLSLDSEDVSYDYYSICVKWDFCLKSIQHLETEEKSQMVWSKINVSILPELDDGNSHSMVEWNHVKCLLIGHFEHRNKFVYNYKLTNTIHKIHFHITDYLTIECESERIEIPITELYKFVVASWSENEVTLYLPLASTPHVYYTKNKRMYATSLLSALSLNPVLGLTLEYDKSNWFDLWTLIHHCELFPVPLFDTRIHMQITKKPFDVTALYHPLAFSNKLIRDSLWAFSVLCSSRSVCFPQYAREDIYQFILSKDHRIIQLFTRVLNSISDRLFDIKTISDHGNNESGHLFKKKHLISYWDDITEHINEAYYSIVVNSNVYPDDNKLDLNQIKLDCAVITQSSIICLPPIICHSSRLLRNYSYLRIISVAFRDEQYQKLHGADCIGRIDSILKNGFTLHGSRYSFLACSNSQLRDHKALFVTFPNPDDAQAKIQRIRNSILGDTKIDDEAKYMSRLGLFCTSDYPTVKINKAKVFQIGDIWANNGVLVTDGAGKIDRELAYTVNGILLDSNCRFQRFFEEGINCPAAYQIRLAGYKGVLVVVNKENDPDFLRYNPNASILVRHSMYKFNWTNSTLGIIKTTKFNKVKLNRDVITLLTSLRDNTGRWNPGEVLKYLMRQELTHFADILHDEQKAFKEIAQNLPNFFKSKSQRLNLYFKQVGARFNVLCEPFLFSLLRLIYTYNIKSLKSKTYIPIEDGALLMGIPDPFGVLQDNQVFVIYKTNEASSEVTILHGPVLVYRNPCMHPGDLLRLTAVDHPLLHNLINVIVFPIKGSKSLPGSTGGGDLDGDEFSVIWDKRLIPPRHCVVNSLNYDEVALDAKSRYRSPCPDIVISADTDDRIKDRLAEFYCRIVENESIGKVANLHLLVSDHLEKGALDPIAIELAKSQCIAVDFPKTGIPPEVPPEALKIKKTFGYPDFMEKKREASYLSKKPLGELYRMCQSMCYDAFTANNTSNSGKDTLQQLTKAYALSLNVDGSDLYMDKARNIYHYYCNEFGKILKSFGIESEQEAILKLFINWHPMMDSRKYKVTGILDVEITQLFEKFRLILVNQLSNATMSEKLRLASACYQVAYGEHHSCSNLQFLSFPWILGDLLCSIPKQPLNLPDSNYESIGVSANAYLINLKNHIQCTVNLKMSAYSVLEATIDEKSRGAFTTSTFGFVSHYLCDPDSILEISVTPTQRAFSRPFVPPTMEISQFRILSISQQNAHFLENVILNYINKVALSQEFISGVPLIHCTIESPSQSGIEIKVDITVNSIGVQKAKHIQNLYKKSGGVVFAWLWLLVHWARQCRIIKWDIIEHGSCILSTDEFIAFALYILDKMPSHCEHFNGSSRICTLSEILDSITPETNKCTLGRLLVHFFIQGTKIAFDGRAITYEWPIEGNPRSCTIGEQALAELSKLLFQAQQSLTYSRDIEKLFGSLNNPTPYIKILPPVLTARLEGAMQFHSTRLEHLSGAKVNMRMKGRLIQVNGHGSPAAIQKLNIEVEKLVYMSQLFKRPKMNTSKYLMPDGFLMWMVNGDTTSRVELSLGQIDCFHLLHEASERNRIILANHERNPNWLALAKENIQNVVIRQLTSFTTDKYECLNSLRFLARFGNFYLVNSSRDFNNIGGSVSLSDLENKLRNKKIYLGATAITAITGKFGEPDGNSNVLRTVPLPVMRSNPNRSRIESSSKNRYLHCTFCPSVIPVASASDNRASTIYNSVLIGCGFTPVRRPSGSYKWKLCIAASNDCEVQMFLNSRGDILKIIERPIVWLHATLIADRRDFTQIDRNSSRFLNDVRFKMEAADVVLPGSQLDQVLFPDSNRVRPLISYRTPKVISRFKDAVLILKRYTSKNFYKNGSIYARISNGIDYTGVDLGLHRTFCELALYFSEDELRSALKDGNNTSKIQSIVDDAINISMAVSNRLAIYDTSF